MKKVIVIATLVAAWALQSIFDWSPEQLGYYHGCLVINRVWFSLFHANVWHLVVNSYAVWVCLNDRMMIYRVLLPFLLTAAFAASWVSNMTAPTVGASAMLYAMMGLNMSACYNWRYWVLMAVSLLAGFVIPGVNAAAHIAAFVPGLAAGRLVLLYRMLCDDRRAANL